MVLLAPCLACLLLLAAQLVQTEHKRVEPAVSQVLATRTVLCGPLPASVRANSELPAPRPTRDATACLRGSSCKIDQPRADSGILLAVLTDQACMLAVPVYM